MHLSESIQEAEENTLSSYFVKLAQALLIATNRPDSTEKYLRMASYQSLSTLIQVAGSENAQGVYDLTAMMIQTLRASLNSNVVSIEDSLILTDLQSFICSFLMVRYAAYRRAWSFSSNQNYCRMPAVFSILPFFL
jgi:hypothetical protein